MKFAAFQRAVHETEPRGIVIFTSPLVDVIPHIAVQAEEFSLDVRVYARGRLVNHAGNLDPDVATKVESEGIFADESQTEPLLPIVKTCLDAGMWLVIPEPASIDIGTWREIGKLLVSAVPEERNYLTRRHFRLFTFATQGISLPSILPPLICHFAFIVDNAGAVKTRAQLGPLFDGTVTMQGYRALAEFSKNDAEVQSNHYVQMLLASMKTNAPQADEERCPATDIMYVNEVLFKLREALIEQQSVLLAEAQKADQEADDAFEVVVARQRDKYGDEYDEQKDRNVHLARMTAEKQLMQHHDWIYQKMLEWLVSQCPDADISNLPLIPDEDIALGDTLWVRDTEEAFESLWNACQVTQKKPLLPLIDDAAAVRQKQFAAEAARHVAFRHPNVVNVYGITGSSTRVDSLILEASTGTLEQRLIAARFDGNRWSVAQFIDACVDILRGMAYLANVAVHRDISTRSVMLCGSTFKIGQFTCALPISYIDSEAKRGVVPARWTAPEGFAGQFSPASDMWSFGILLWMAVQYSTTQAYADEPFPPAAITSGVIPPRPRECPAFLYDDVIAKCLSRDPGARPTATKCLLSLQTAKRALPLSTLQAEVPFPGDECSFEDWQIRRARAAM